MSTDSLTTGPAGESWADDEIDLRRYVAILARRWLEIVLLTVLVVAIVAGSAYLYTRMSQPMYEAVATAAIVRTSTDVKFDERFTTTADPAGGQDSVSRRAALAGLVANGAIAEQVIAELGAMLTREEQQPATLMEMVKGQIGGIDGRPGQSDLITIMVTADAPEKAAAIANAWTAAYVQEVNRIYGQVPDEMLTSVQAELAEADNAYAVAQANLEAFVATSQLTSLRRQADEKQQTIAALERSKVAALETYVDELERSYQRIAATYLDAQTTNQLLAFTKEQEGQRALLNSYFDAYNAARVDTFTAQADQNRAALRMLYEQVLHTTAHLATARTLAAQLAAGGAGATEGTGMALQLLKLQVVADGSRLPLTMGELYQTPTQLAGQPGTSDEIVSTKQVGENREGATAPATVNQILLGGSAGLNNVPDMPAALQVQVATAPTSATLPALQADVQGLIQSLEGRLAETEQAIAALEQSLLAGDDFPGLTQPAPETGALVDAIRTQYPQLFARGIFSTIGDAASGATDLTAAGQQQGASLLALASSDALPLFEGVDAPMAQAIAQLEAEVRTIQAQLEAEQARDLQVKQQRDQTWESYKALSNKLAELNLARAAGNSEVRLGISAVPPNEPLQGVSLLLSVALAAVVGLLLALVVALVREYLNRPPLFTQK